MNIETYKTHLPARLPLGGGIVGPDWPGCINSGAAPAICKSKLGTKYLGKPFFVGGEMAFKFYLADIVGAAMRGKRTDDARRWKVRFFKNYKPAKRYWLKLVADVLIQHQEAHDAAARMSDKTASHAERMAAAQIVSDHGLM